MGNFFGGNNNKRRYRRVALDRPAEIIVNTIDVYVGRIVNISPGDVALQCTAEVRTGDTAIVYVRDLDILPGRIIRHLPDGFAMSLMLSKSRRAQLTEKLFVHTNTSYQSKIDERRAAPRHKKGDERSLCMLPDGSSIYVKIIDMSVNGAAIDSTRKPDIGTSVRLTQRNGVVIRHTPRGFAISFDGISFTQNRSQKMQNTSYAADQHAMTRSGDIPKRA